MNVAVLGTGLMGSELAKRLLKAGHAVTVYNRTRAKARPLAAFGAKVAANAREAVAGSQCVVLMLSEGKVIQDVVLKRQFPGKGKTFIQMGTIAPAESVSIAREFHHRGAQYWECPVLGSRSEAAAGKLILMVGATPLQFGRWKNFLKCFGPRPRLIGPVGKAAALKLALNQLIASLAAGFCLSLGLVQRCRIPVDLFMAILRQSALYAPMFDKKLPGMVKNRFGNPNFPTKHLLKDVRLIVQEADRTGLLSAHLREIERVIDRGMRAGLGAQDYSSIYRVFLGRE